MNDQIEKFFQLQESYRTSRDGGEADERLGILEEFWCGMDREDQLEVVRMDAASTSTVPEEHER